MRNLDVVNAWSQGRPAHTENLWTDGTILRSYDLTIGKIEDGRKIVLDYRTGGRYGFVSVTTSRHVSLACRVAPRA